MNFQEFLKHLLVNQRLQNETAVVIGVVYHKHTSDKKRVGGGNSTVSYSPSATPKTGYKAVKKYSAKATYHPK